MIDPRSAFIAAGTALLVVTAGWIILRQPSYPETPREPLWARATR